MKMKLQPRHEKLLNLLSCHPEGMKTNEIVSHFIRNDGPIELQSNDKVAQIIHLMRKDENGLIESMHIPNDTANRYRHYITNKGLDIINPEETMNTQEASEQEQTQVKYSVEDKKDSFTLIRNELDLIEQQYGCRDYNIVDLDNKIKCLEKLYESNILNIEDSLILSSIKIDLQSLL